MTEKQFYYFDNSIWRIHKIEDWGIGANDTVKVTFVKVIDVENYTSITVDYFFTDNFIPLGFLRFIKSPSFFKKAFS